MNGVNLQNVGRIFVIHRPSILFWLCVVVFCGKPSSKNLTSFVSISSKSIGAPNTKHMHPLLDSLASRRTLQREDKNQIRSPLRCKGCHRSRKTNDNFAAFNQGKRSHTCTKHCEIYRIVEECQSIRSAVFYHELGRLRVPPQKIVASAVSSLQSLRGALSPTQYSNTSQLVVKSEQLVHIAQSEDLTGLSYDEVVARLQCEAKCLLSKLSLSK